MPVQSFGTLPGCASCWILGKAYCLDASSALEAAHERCAAAAGIEPDLQLQDLLQSDPVPVQGIIGNHDFPWPSHFPVAEAGNEPSFQRGASLTPPSEAHSANTLQIEPQALTPTFLNDFPDSWHSFLGSDRATEAPGQGQHTANGATAYHGGNNLGTGASTQPDLTLPQAQVPSPQGSLQDDSQSPAAAAATAATQQAKQEAKQQRVREKNRRAMQKFRNRQRVGALLCFRGPQLMMMSCLALLDTFGHLSIMLLLSIALTAPVPL